jgi:type II secretory pathway pseudopilin PulG
MQAEDHHNELRYEIVGILGEGVVRVRNAKGFTVLEYVIALTLLSLIMVMVVTMFRSQSQYGRDTGKEIAVDEAVSMALMLIRQDIMHAGLGVADKPKLAVFLQTKVGSGYEELYLNYGRYLDTNYAVPDNVFAKPAYAKNMSGTQVNTEAFISQQTRYKYLQPSDVGAMISYDPSAGTVTGHTITSTTAGETPYEYTFTVNPALTGTVAPAIRYSLQSNALMRNSETILGGETNFRVTSFSVRASFWDSATGSTVWSPTAGDSTKDFDKLLPSKLRYLEVTIGYQIRRETLAQQTGTAAGWSRTISKSIMVAPRTVMLGQY